MDITPTLTRIAVGALLTVGVAFAGMELGAPTAQADPFRWCPGDPPPKAFLPVPGGGWAPGPVNPDWDETVCHDYNMRDYQVAEGGLSCPLPEFQWSQCPPGRTPPKLMPLIPNK